MDLRRCEDGGHAAPAASPPGSGARRERHGGAGESPRAGGMLRPMGARRFAEGLGEEGPLLPGVDPPPPEPCEGGSERSWP